jgi:hypothetical protein
VGAATIDLSYRERLFYWIRTVFPNQNHTFHNGALAAAPSSYMSQCIHDFAPPHSDLVFVEVRAHGLAALLALHCLCFVPYLAGNLARNMFSHEPAVVQFTMNDGQKTCDVTTDGR